MQFNLELLYDIQLMREALGPAGVTIMNMFSEYAQTLLLAVPMYLYWCVDKKRGYMIFLTMTSANLINSFIKLTTCIERPWVLDERITPPEIAVQNQGGYSFPSGHTQFAAAYLVGVAHHVRKKWCTFLCWVILILVAFSRCYLGVHTPLDVIVGILESLVMLAVFERVVEKVYGDEKAMRKLLLITLVIVTLVALYFNFKPYPLHYDAAGELVTDPISMITYSANGSFLGVALGMYIEQKYIRFSTDLSRRDRIIRLVVGAILYIPLEKILRANFIALLGYAMGRGCADFLLMIFPTMIYPLLFRFLPGYKKAD